MNRRIFLQSLAAGGALPFALARPAEAALSDLAITRIRIFNPTGTTGLSGWLNQSEIIVAIDTDAGITGIGQGGTRDILRDAAGVLIGKDPFRTEYLWQRMYRSTFYPPGREKLHAIGALDCALWDIKGKAAELPVYQMLGGRARDHVECYSTRGTLTLAAAREEARRAMAQGFRAIRFHGVEADNGVFDSRRAVEATAAICAELREGVGADGEFILDAHTRFDLADALRLIELIAPLRPLFVEDPLRTIDDTQLFAVLRSRVSVPLAAGEQFGDLRDGNLPLVEQGLIDYLRASIPNVGGITGFRKIAALCEAHSVGLVPHFTAPISTAAVIHALTAFPGAALNEVLRSALPGYLREAFDFRDGKIFPNDRPGLGVVLDEAEVNLVDEFTEARSDGLYQGESYHRPDGSYLYL
jgi:L-alanine-DL-glutamate epimerase-like enolase superfamily enzyme